MAPTDKLVATLHAALAAELREMRILVEQLAEHLLADEHFVMHHVERLQSFDLLVQHADEAAHLLDRIADGSHVHDAVDAVRLDAVQARLRAALGGRVSEAA
jgi:hypothetical protein